MRFLRACVLVVVAFAGVVAAPKVDKVEPPNWWTPHSYNPVQVLLTGSELKGATVTTSSRGFKIEVRQASENGHYLFVYLNIGKNAQAGTHRFRIKGTTGTAEFQFRLDKPLETRGRYQGFGPDDVIYLFMPDRFANGDPANDSPPEYGRPADRKNAQAYHGGDFRGVMEHLAYLKDLGVTGIWVTPAYKNSNPTASPYHGYHTVDFYDVEPRFGSMQEFKQLVDQAHAAGIKVVQDQVANHCGPRHPWVTDPPTKTWFNYLERTPRPRNNYDIAALADPYARPKQRDLPLRGWFAGNLPDFNQDDPLVTDYLIENALWWIGMTGIDAIRQDTYPYVDRPFWEKWQTAIDRQFPGFVVVGEITASTPAALSFFEGGIRRYGVDTKLPTMLDFPLESAVRSVFAQGQPMTRLTDILAQDSLYRRPEMLVAFMGNHDQPRMMTVAKSDLSKVLMAETFVLTTRRVAHLYYGDEIAMEGGNDPDNRRDFPGGWAGDAVNEFTPQGRSGLAATAFNWTRDLLHFRQAHPAVRRGGLVQLLVNQDQYAYLRTSPEENVLVVLNRAGSAKPIQLDVDDLPLPEGLRFKPFPAGPPDLVVTGGKLMVEQPKETQIYWTERLNEREFGIQNTEFRTRNTRSPVPSHPPPVAPVSLLPPYAGKTATWQVLRPYAVVSTAPSRSRFCARHRSTRFHLVRLPSGLRTVISTWTRPPSPTETRPALSSSGVSAVAGSSSTPGSNDSSAYTL